MAFNKLMPATEETGNFNIADHYRTYIVFKHISNIDEYDKLAQFGTSDIMDALQIDPEQIPRIRIMALRRMAKHMQMLIGDTKFALRKSDKEEMEHYYNEVMQIKQIVDSSQIEDVHHSVRTKKRSIRLNEETFNKLHEMLIELKMRILQPLNRASLIFFHVEEYDSAEMKRMIMHRAMTQG